jgi:hypothetical protein
MGRRTIDFDSIYTTIFSPAIESAVLPDGGKIKGRHTDKDFFTGDITTEMFRYLEYSRFVLCDITGLNPNVFKSTAVPRPLLNLFKEKQFRWAMFRSASMLRDVWTWVSATLMLSKSGLRTVSQSFKPCPKPPANNE